MTYKADDKVVEEQVVAHGADATAPKVPRKFGYRGKWDHNGKNITADLTITAKYTKRSHVDWRNPETGDYIMVAVTVLAISGAGLAGLLILSKRKNKK